MIRRPGGQLQGNREAQAMLIHQLDFNVGTIANVDIQLDLGRLLDVSIRTSLRQDVHKYQFILDVFLLHKHTIQET